MAVLVATVGESPAPVLLACASHQAVVEALGRRLDHIVLVHSSGTHGEALRVQTALMLLRPGMWTSELVDLGDRSSDVAALLEAFESRVQAAVGDADEVRLDFTGGTKAMCAAAVLWHERRGGARAAALRSYVDDIGGRLVTADGRRYYLEVPVGLNLEQMAAMNGYQLVVRVKESTTPEQKAGDLHEKAVTEALHRLVRQHEQVRCEHCPGDEDDASRGHPRYTHEVLTNQTFVDPAQPGVDLGEMDTILRWGSRVLVVEAKARASEGEAESAWAVARGQAAFGRAAKHLLVSKDVPSSLSAPGGLLGQGAMAISLSELSSWAQDASLAHDQFHLQLAEVKLGDLDPRRGLVLPGGSRGGIRPSVVTAVGDSLLAPAVAVASSAGTAALVLENAVGGLTEPGRSSLTAAITRSAPAARVTYAKIDPTSELAVGEAISTVQAPLWDATAGTKAVTAAMAVRVLSGGGTIAINDVRSRSRSSLSFTAGDPKTLHAKRTELAPIAVDWSRLLGVDWDTLATGEEIPSPVASVALNALDGALVGVATTTQRLRWRRRAGGLEGIWAIASRDRLIAVAVLGRSDRVDRTGKPQRRSAGAFVTPAINVHHTLSAVGGPAVATLAVWDAEASWSHPVEVVEQRLRVVERSGWFMRATAVRGRELLRGAGRGDAVRQVVERLETRHRPMP